jgi:hypothetical protein
VGVGVAGLATGCAGATGRATGGGQAIVLIATDPIERLGALTAIATMLTFDSVPLPVGSG